MFWGTRIDSMGFQTQSSLPATNDERFWIGPALLAGRVSKESSISDGVAVGVLENGNEGDSFVMGLCSDCSPRSLERDRHSAMPGIDDEDPGWCMISTI